jgi:predicted  nucleic acid-binding Zn-ribbon protein
MRQMKHNTYGLWLIAVVLLAGGCQSTYYKTMEMFGQQKRDLLVSDVKKARDAQDAAKVQFASALEQFSSVVNVPGGELEKKYKTLNAEYERSKSRADAVKGRLNEVKRVGTDLFAEWDKELDTYKSDNLRRASQVKMVQTQKQYDKLIAAMEKAESKITPVLDAFGDQVLFLKHNLNAQAISSLQGELGNMETEIGSLIKEMEKSIGEADSFIQQMTQKEG